MDVQGRVQAHFVVEPVLERDAANVTKEVGHRKQRLRLDAQRPRCSCLSACRIENARVGAKCSGNQTYVTRCVGISHTLQWDDITSKALQITIRQHVAQGCCKWSLGSDILHSASAGSGNTKTIVLFIGIWSQPCAVDATVVVRE